MDTITNIMSRRSVRYYLDKEISDEDLKTILHAGMAGPSCTHARDWSFIVTRDPEVLNLMADGNGGPAGPLRRAKLGIMILGDLERAFKPAPDYWVIDGAIAGQNMILAANALGIGSVWLGTWPQMERVNKQIANFNLPDTVIPHSIIAFGYPDEEEEKKPHMPEKPKDMPDMPPMDKPMGPPPKMVKGEYEPDRIHMDRW